jgi:hypothetical protein
VTLELNFQDRSHKSGWKWQEVGNNPMPRQKASKAFLSRQQGAVLYLIHKNPLKTGLV